MDPILVTIAPEPERVRMRGQDAGDGDHLGLLTEPLPRARARDPTGQESFDFDAA